MNTVFLILNDDDVCYGVFATEEAAQKFLDSAEAKMGWLRWEVLSSRIEEWEVNE